MPQSVDGKKWQVSWTERATFPERGLRTAGKYSLHSSRTFYFLHRFSCCSSSPEAASHKHLGSYNGSILFSPLAGIGHYTSSVELPRADFPSSANLFFSGAICRGTNHDVHRECFLDTFFNLCSSCKIGKYMHLSN